MFTHDNIWTAIDRLAQSCGYSASGLSKRAGLDPTTFNRSKRISPDGKPRWPSTESISKILAVTGSTLSDLVSLMDMQDDGDASNRPAIPIIGLSQASKDKYFDADGNPTGTGWDYIPTFGATEPGVFALRVDTDSLRPVYRENDILIVNRHQRTNKCDRAVLKLRGGEIAVMEIGRRMPGETHILALGKADKNRVIDPDTIVWTAKILWASQ